MHSDNDMNGAMADRFVSLCARAGTGDTQRARAVFEDLVRRYNEPGRAYHNLPHIQACLKELDHSEPCSPKRDLIEWSIWFHDAVYDPRRKDNEALSAELAHRHMANMGITRPASGDITRLILATRHTSQPASDDEMLMVDIDLSILGQPESTFDAYDRAIRTEYEWVPAEDYHKGRATILYGFLSRPAIFNTRTFQERYEGAARVNLRRAIERLG